MILIHHDLAYFTFHHISYFISSMEIFISFHISYLIGLLVVAEGLLCVGSAIRNFGCIQVSEGVFAAMFVGCAPPEQVYDSLEW